MKENVLEELKLKEDHERECKLATGGLPESIWETYSSFANTNGGTILLGIKEHRDSFTVEGLTEKQIIKYQKDFWSTLNDRNKVSKNILLNHHVRPVLVGEKKILRIDVPAADRHDKPVYIGPDPMKGTYKRDFEGDFLCTEEAVRAMFADQRDVSGDIEVVDEMGFVNRRDGYRVDRVDVHDALEEALANALAHANYYGRRGILVVKKGKELTISNPGTIRVTKEEFYAGGNSDPRNPNILKMFGFVNVGERAGSGVDKIMTAWKEQNWKKPEFDFSERSDRVTLKLEVGQVVYIPGAADLHADRQVESTETDEIGNLNKEQRVMHYLKSHESISTQEAMVLCEYKTRAGARRLLDKMIQNDILRKTGSGPGAKYILNDAKKNRK